MLKHNLLHTQYLSNINYKDTVGTCNICPGIATARLQLLNWKPLFPDSAVKRVSWNKRKRMLMGKQERKIAINLHKYNTPVFNGLMYDYLLRHVRANNR